MKLYISLFLMCMAVIFIVQNAEVVEIKYLLWTLSISRALLMFLVLAIGIIIGWLLHNMAGSGKMAK